MINFITGVKDEIFDAIPDSYTLGRGVGNFIIFASLLSFIWAIIWAIMAICFYLVK